ncbi:MAG: class I SAM-dependent methyltransferase [Natronomonas sp.]
MTSIDPDEHEHIPGEAASTYAKIADAYGQQYYESVAGQVLDHLEDGMRMLDVGTGPGLLPIEIAMRLHGIRIDGFDFTRELIRYARESATIQGVSNRVSFFVADAYRIPVHSGQYAFLISTGVLHSLDDSVRALTEWYRVLEPGGSAWVFDPAILDLPETVDIDLTDKEREILATYGVRKDEPTPISRTEAKRLVDASPFEDAEIGTGPYGDRRLYLTRTG